MLASGKQQCLCWQLPNVRFLYIILHMAIKFSRHQYQCFAFSYHRQREILSYRSVSHIPIIICPRLAAKVWLVWSWPYQFFVYSTGPRSHTSKGLAIYARSDLVELRSFVSTGEQWTTIVLLAFSLSD